MSLPTYKKPEAQAYHLILNSKDALSSIDGSFEFPITWSRPITHDQTYHLLVQSFDVHENIQSTPFQTQLYTISINEAFNNVYHSSDYGTSSALVVGKGGSFRAANMSVGGVLQNPQFLQGTPIRITFKDIVTGVCPTAISDAANTWAISLLIMPVNM